MHRARVWSRVVGGQHGGTVARARATRELTSDDGRIAVGWLVTEDLFPCILARVARTNSRELFTLGAIALASGCSSRWSWCGTRCMGVELKVLPEEGESYIVAGALLSIVLNPLWFALLGRTRAASPVSRRTVDA